MHVSPRQHRRSFFPHVQEAVAQPVGVSVAGPEPTERAVVPEGTAWLDKRQAVIVYTTAADDPGSSSTKAPVPVGPIVGGVVAGVFIVLLAGGFWWWWVANKPKESTEPKKTAKNKNLPEVAPGVVPLPVSYARSRPSAPGTASPASSTSHQPQMNERGWTPPVVAGMPSSSHPTPPPAARTASGRSVSGSSDAPLLGGRSTSGSSSRGPSPLATSPTKKSYNPAKPSPLSAAAAAPPRWGAMPFVSSPPRSQEGHAMDVLSTSPNSITPLNKHLDVRRSSSNGMLSTDSHGSGAGAAGDRMSMVSEQSRYSQGPGLEAMSSEGGHQVELGRQVSGEWGVAYDVEDDQPAAGRYGYGGGQEVMGQGYQPPAGRESAGYLDEELESYYRPKSGM